MTRFFAGVSVSVLVLAASTSLTWAQPVWESAAGLDQRGGRVATLTFGAPGSDVPLMAATCRSDMPGQVHVVLNLPLAADTPPGAASASIAVGRRVETRPALIERSGGGKDSPVVSLMLGRDDPLWQMLMAGISSRLSADGNTWVEMHLRGSRAAITQFMRGCDTIATTAPEASLDLTQPMVPLAGPLFVVGDAPAEATSAFSGAPLEPFAPGTELMATGSANTLDGEEWIEIRPGRGSGPAAWVRRSALVPVSGGATQYQNLNLAQNLLLRGSPNAQATPVAAVPPRATGIIDQGEREGGWVLVRFGNVTGWAPHDELLPMFPVTTVEIPPDTEIPLALELEAETAGEGAPPAEGDEAVLEAPDPAFDDEAAVTGDEAQGAGEGTDVAAADTEEAAAGAEAVPDGETAVEAPAYEAAHRDWTVTCDPCNAGEEPVCSLRAGVPPDSLSIVPDEARPQRVGDIRIGMDLPPDPRGTLTVTVDGAQVVAIPPASVTYMAMTGEFLVQQPHVDAMLTAMIGGNAVSVAFTDDAGAVHSFSVPLAGFSAGVTDLLATAPQYPRDAACPM